MNIQQNLIQIQKNITKLKEKFNIDYEIIIVAVSKRKPVEDINQAISAGHYIFGENRIQEAVEKIPQIKVPEVNWHFIGHLQSNKVKQAVEIFDVIHSIDKYETAKEVSKRCQQFNKTMDIFIQINTTDEEQKSGIKPEELQSFINDIRQLPNINIVGLMTISLFTDDQDEIRKSFRLLRELKEEMKSKYPELSLNYLSMGMSGDYELAIQEGATHIRLGTSIFGKREY